jgi:ammonium transporter, Amt family
VPPWAALVIGVAAGIVCFGAVRLKSLFHYDDALDVVGVHMVAGVIGVVLIGVFASLVVNPGGVASGWTQLGRQAVLALVALAYPFVTTWIVVWVTDKVVGMRVSPGEQAEGLDLGEYNETGYELDASR